MMTVGQKRIRAEGAVMRRLLVALGVLASTSSVFAGEFDLPTLRGSNQFVPASPTYYPWSGAYAGGQLGYSGAGVNFGGGVSDIAAFLVRNTVLESVVSELTTLPKAETSGSSFGAFIGRNFRWDDLILGVEVNYSRGVIRSSATDSVSVIYANDAGAPPGHHFVYDPLTVTGSASIRVTDLATFRARAGWAVDQFMPYGFVALAVARADVSRSATVFTIRRDFPDAEDPPLVPIPDEVIGPNSRAEEKNGGFYAGYAAGLGADVAVLPNVFLRGEWEIVHLPNIKGMSITLNSLRGGIGMKF
jgi:opacity protein-like surface antigen